MTTLVEGLHVEVLGDSDRAELLALIDADPHVNVAADMRVRASRRLSSCGTVLGVRASNEDLRAATLDAGNLLPIGGDEADWQVLGERLRRQARGCSSIVGRAGAVTGLWSGLAGRWGQPRAVRGAQPLLVLDRADALPAGDPRVRRMQSDDLDRYLPASAAMFAEELGADPFRTSGPGEYRQRVAALIGAGRSFGIVQDGQVVFKADVGVVGAAACQVHGVWVRPDLRGRGIAGAALASVLRRALDLAPAVNLYVNDFNVPARRLYARLGMREEAVLSTILF